MYNLLNKLFHGQESSGPVQDNRDRPWLNLPGKTPPDKDRLALIMMERAGLPKPPPRPGLDKTLPLVVPGQGGLGDIAQLVGKADDDRIALILSQLMDDLNPKRP